MPIFRDLPHETLLRLSEAVRPREFGRGELIASAGDSIDNIMIVAAGKLRMVHVSPSGREQIVREVGPGEFIGELGLAMSARYDGDVVAAEETLACVLPISAVREAISSSPEAAMRLIEALVRRLAGRSRWWGSGRPRRGASGWRLSWFGRRGARAVPGCSGKGGSNVVVLPGPWSEMAARLGTTPESLSRRLRALEEEGLIARPAGGEAELERDGSRRVVILDIERLEEIAGL